MKKTLLPTLAVLVLLSACSIPKIGSTPETETIVTDDTTATTGTETPADTTQ